MVAYPTNHTRGKQTELFVFFKLSPYAPAQEHVCDEERWLVCEVASASGKYTPTMCLP